MPQKLYTEIEVAFSLEKLVRMFEVTAVKEPKLARGLAMACGLTKLWSQMYAPGAPSHPYLNFGLKMPEVIEAGCAGTIEMEIPLPTERKVNFENLGEDKKEIIKYILSQQGQIISKNVLKKFRDDGRILKAHQVLNSFGLLTEAGILIKETKGVYRRADGE